MRGRSESDPYPNLEEAVSTFGPEIVRSHYIGNRNRALERGLDDEAEHWERKWEAVATVVVRRRRKYIIVSVVVSVLMALALTSLDVIRWTSPWQGTFVFVLFSVVLYLVVRFIDRVLAFAAGALPLLAIIILGWQTFEWLQTGSWPTQKVRDVFLFLHFDPAPVRISGWVGLSDLLNSSILWVANLSLIGGCFYLWLLVLCIGYCAWNHWNIPRTSEELGF